MSDIFVAYCENLMKQKNLTSIEGGLSIGQTPSAPHVGACLQVNAIEITAASAIPSCPSRTVSGSRVRTKHPSGLYPAALSAAAGLSCLHRIRHQKIYQYLASLIQRSNGLVSAPVNQELPARTNHQENDEGRERLPIKARGFHPARPALYP